MKSHGADNLMAQRRPHVSRRQSPVNIPFRVGYPFRVDPVRLCLRRIRLRTVCADRRRRFGFALGAGSGSLRLVVVPGGARVSVAFVELGEVAGDAVPGVPLAGVAAGVGAALGAFGGSVDGGDHRVG
jgi:hypothetical protein